MAVTTASPLCSNLFMLEVFILPKICHEEEEDCQRRSILVLVSDYLKFKASKSLALLTAI